MGRGNFSLSAGFIVTRVVRAVKNVPESRYFRLSGTSDDVLYD